MKAKEYLQQVYRADRHIRMLQRQKDDLHAQLYSLGSPSGNTDGKVQTSPRADRTINLMAKIEDREERIVEEIDRLVDMKEKISRQIMQMPNEKHAEILHCRYIMLMSWREVSRTIGPVNDRAMYRMHGRALQEFSEMYLKNGHVKYSNNP